NGRGAVTFTTPALVERTELVGPATATVYAATTDEELLLFLSLWVVDVDGNRHLLTRGWLRGSLREVDEARSEPWLPEHPYTNPKPVTPDAVHLYEITLAPTSYVVARGQRILLHVS